MRTLASRLGLAAWLTLLPLVAAAQTSGIAGEVKDTSGAILPGVTVEVTSPALIEKVRSATTDGAGRYSITNLRARRLHGHVHVARLQHDQTRRTSS